MIEIKDLLNRFKKILLSEIGKRDIIKNVIFEVVGIKIKTRDITLKNNIIYLNTKPIYKNEIFMKKDQVFLKLNEIFRNNSPWEIR